MFKLMQRNAGPIRSLFGDPILGAGVEELLEDLRAAIGRGDLPPLDADYMAGAMAGAALELGVRMAEREPADVDGAARFATQLFLGGISRMAADDRRAGRRPRRARCRAAAARRAARSSSSSSRPAVKRVRDRRAAVDGRAALRRPSTSATSTGPVGGSAESSSARWRSRGASAAAA